jgi:hypothetical protein
MFDSPFEFCPHCRQYVLLDQTQPQCAREHACPKGVRCPLDRYFTGIDFAGTGAPAVKPAARGGAALASERRARAGARPRSTPK